MPTETTAATTPPATTPPATTAPATDRTGLPSGPHGAPWALPALAGGAVLVVALVGVPAAVGATTLALQALFLVFFVRHLAFVAAAARTAPGSADGPFREHDEDVADEDTTGWYSPPLTVMVACHDEERVLGRLLPALDALRYPPGRLQLVLVDDNSSDRTGELLDAWERATPGALVLHRPPGSTGGKSGALNRALREATGEVVVVFDADHRPRPDVLLRLARHFADPGVGAVQGRCRILNGGDSLVAELVEVDYLGGYLVNEYGRQAVFRLPAYGGACCAARTTSLRAVDGWNEGTVTEDTDLTLRMALTGQRVCYDVTAVDEEEAVTTLRRYWTQRYRWARGHQQAWRDFRGAVWRSRRFTLLEKVETTMFLLVFHLPALALVGVGLLVAGFFGLATPPTRLDDATAVVWTLLLLGPVLELSTGLLLTRAPKRKAFLLVFFLPLFTVSMLLCTKAWVDGLLGRPYTWAKTARSEGPLRPATAGSR